ncbi:MAG: hypothetical protein HRU38_06995 [Saccharospirillaceae bacterium]|nr:hypothetical protein [Saccharospirillaceae bacterium]
MPVVVDTITQEFARMDALLICFHFSAAMRPEHSISKDNELATTDNFIVSKLSYGRTLLFTGKL